MLGFKVLPLVHGSHPHTPAPYGPSTPAPHYGALGYRPPSYGYTPRPAPYAPPRPHYPASAAPSYHGHSLAVTPKPHGSDYGPPVCVKNATIHTYCLEDYEYPTYEIQVINFFHYFKLRAYVRKSFVLQENVGNLKQTM